MSSELVAWWFALCCLLFAALGWAKAAHWRREYNKVKPIPFHQSGGCDHCRFLRQMIEAMRLDGRKKNV